MPLQMDFNMRTRSSICEYMFFTRTISKENGCTQPRPRPLLGWLWQLSLAGLVNFRLAFGNYRNGHLPSKGLVDFTSSQISPITS
jgi:hypothetical protein